MKSLHWQTSSALELRRQFKCNSPNFFDWARCNWTYSSRVLYWFLARISMFKLMRMPSENSCTWALNQSTNQSGVPLRFRIMFQQPSRAKPMSSQSSCIGTFQRPTSQSVTWSNQWSWTTQLITNSTREILVVEQSRGTVTKHEPIASLTWKRHCGRGQYYMTAEVSENTLQW